MCHATPLTLQRQPASISRLGVLTSRCTRPRLWRWSRPCSSNRGVKLGKRSEAGAAEAGGAPPKCGPQVHGSSKHSAAAEAAKVLHIVGSAHPALPLQHPGPASRGKKGRAGVRLAAAKHATITLACLYPRSQHGAKEPAGNVHDASHDSRWPGGASRSARPPLLGPPLLPTAVR